MLKKTILFAVVAGLVLALAPAAQGALTGQLGILDATVLAGNNPATGSPWELGDKYHLAFLTSTTHNAISDDISVYNAFVQGVADGGASIVKTAGAVNWKAICSVGVASTDPTVAIVDARTNTGTGSGVGFPSYRLDSEMLAEDYADLFNGLNVRLCVDEAGVEHGNQSVWTGSNNDCLVNQQYLPVPGKNGPVGDPDGQARCGKTVDEGGNFATDNALTSGSKVFYAFSDPLQIVPEPASAALLLIGAPLLALRRRRRSCRRS